MMPLASTASADTEYAPYGRLGTSMVQVVVVAPGEPRVAGRHEAGPNVPAICGPSANRLSATRTSTFWMPASELAVPLTVKVGATSCLATGELMATTGVGLLGAIRNFWLNPRGSA